MNNLLFVLGASDPEMTTIEQLLVECGVSFAYAQKDESRVHPGNMYSADTVHIPPGVERVVMVECDAPLDADVEVIRCDHHRPGDPGFGLPPERFLEASSIGQAISILAREGAIARAGWEVFDSCVPLGSPEGISRVNFSRKRNRAAYIVRGLAPGAVHHDSTGTDYPREHLVWRIPARYVLVAAADHCLRAAYAGECRGVDPDELMRLRAAHRASFQQRTVKEVLADVEAAKALVQAAPKLELTPGVEVRDMRSSEARQDGRGGAVPELPEAALRLGESYLAGPLLTPDGRRKIVVSGTAEEVLAFRDYWAPANGLTDVYAMPERGMGGGYLS